MTNDIEGKGVQKVPIDAKCEGVSILKKLKYDVKMTIEFEITDDMEKETLLNLSNEEILRVDMQVGILNLPMNDLVSEYEAEGYIIIDDKVVAQRKEKYV